MFWGNFLYLSVNMWGDAPPIFAEELRFDDALWVELTEKMAADGLDLLVIDLGDGVRYDSHPEVAVGKAWSTERLRDELTRLRQLGIEPIPKLNFSATHDAWLRQYSRQVSTPVYYEVCADLIAEVSQLFDTPRFFHIGMDEENAQDQRALQYAVMRQHDLWWHDLLFLVDRVEQAGSRAWMWSDYAWRNPEAFYAKMPKSIVQSNWYYVDRFDVPEEGRPRVLEYADASLCYLDLEDHGYDQVPTASTHTMLDNFADTVAFCAKRIAPERLLGFLQVPWRPTTNQYRGIHLAAIDLVRDAKAAFERGGAVS